jgi:hypothetical protein
MFINMHTLVNAIIVDVRSKCQKLGIEQGAIGISIVPESEEARNWAGIVRRDMSVDFMIPVIEDGNFTLEFDGQIVGNAAGVVGMKLASVKQVMDNNRRLETELTSSKQCTSGALPETCANQHGLTNWRGGIAVPLFKRDFSEPSIPGKRVMTVYVAVSGGEEEQDEEAAWGALGTVMRATALESIYYVPSYCTID